MKQPKVLVLDIETAPILAYIWDLKINGYIPPSQIHTDRYVMAWGAKWLGQKQMIYQDQRGLGPLKDKAILLKLRNLLDKADIVVTYNGKSFDSKRINARLMIHGIRPPTPYKHYDVMRLMKQVADHTSNTLDYISTKVNKKYKKLHHTDYPGINLWLACLREDVKAWNSMKKYNIHDVLSTEEAAMNTLAWAPESFPDFFPTSDTPTMCGRCGYHGYMKAVRNKSAKVHSYHQYRCPNCGGFQTGKKVK